MKYCIRKLSVKCSKSKSQLQNEVAVKICVKHTMHTNVFDKQIARTYKISRPYAMKHCIHSVWYNINKDSETFSVLSSRLNPSQSINADEVQVTFTIIDKINGVPYLGFCTCTVGFSKT